MMPFKKGINGKITEVGSGCNLDKVILCHRRKRGIVIERGWNHNVETQGRSFGFCKGKTKDCLGSCDCDGGKGERVWGERRDESL